MKSCIILVGCGVWFLSACGPVDPAEDSEGSLTATSEEALDPSCSDGVQNGDEVAVDCGGSLCAACVPVGLSGFATYPSDWGGGYCSVLHVTNTLPTTITNWTVVVGLQGTVVLHSWNSIRSGNTGTITFKPAYQWNSTLAPGATDSSVGYCASRPPGAGTGSTQNIFTFQAP
jgi:hypothetical protein